MSAPNVAGLTPDVQHAAALHVLDELRMANTLRYGHSYTGSRTEQSDNGRRRVLERHAPHRQIAPGLWWCSYCVADDHTGQPWPCPDYLDTSDGLVTGLGT